MSIMQSGATASCIVNHSSTREAALAVYDYLVNHPDEIPDAIDEDDDMDSDATVEYLERYMNCESDGKLVISYDTEDLNGDSGVFDFLSHHFACLQSSGFMVTTWWVNDSREGGDSGTDYYDRQGNIINVTEILTKHFEGQS